MDTLIGVDMETLRVLKEIKRRMERGRVNLLSYDLF